MGYLTLTRRESDHVSFIIDPGIDTEKLLSNLLQDGITMHVGKVEAGRVNVGIEVPREITIGQDLHQRRRASQRMLRSITHRDKAPVQPS